MTITPEKSEAVMRLADRIMEIRHEFPEGCAIEAALLRAEDELGHAAYLLKMKMVLGRGDNAE